MRSDVMIHQTADVAADVQVGSGTKIWHHVHIREGAQLGRQCIIGKGAYIDHDVRIGDNVKIQNGANVYSGVTVANGVFIGPDVNLLNDLYPRAVTADGALRTADDWQVTPTHIGHGASLGGGAIILPGVILGEYCLVGAGAVVTRDVPAHALVVGHPARITGFVCYCGKPVADPRDDGEQISLTCSACATTITIQRSIFSQCLR